MSTEFIMEISALIDNTTFASAGRALYVGDFSDNPPFGAAHAGAYYGRFEDAETLDRRSLAELISAVILFDDLRWDGSSAIQEAPEMGAADEVWREAWLYSWFPVFTQKLVRPIQWNRADDTLELAARLAASWVRDRVATGKVEFPAGFVVPMCYGHKDYADRKLFEAIGAGSFLDPTQLSLAMFLHRGLFYQSRALADGVSYLPHHYRSWLLSQPDVLAISSACAIHSLSRKAFSGADVAAAIDKVFWDEIEVAFEEHRELRGAGTAIGWAFLHLYRDPMSAWDEALEFRESDEGIALRSLVREIVEASSGGVRAKAEPYLADLRKQLRDVTLHKIGISPSEEATSPKMLFGLLSPVKNVLEATMSLLPATTQAALMRALYTPLTSPTGVQILYSYYFPDVGPHG